MVKEHKDIWLMVIIILGMGLVWAFLYFNGYLDKKLPEPIQKKTIEKVEKKVEKIINKDNTKNMEDNKYIKLNSGLEYKVIKEGDGPKPVCNQEKCDTVEVHYEGWLEDGKVFDSSYARGEKISFPLNQVIAGWTEGLQLMPVGSVYEFKIPADLAYGNQPMPGIPAGSTLYFKVELFDIK